MFHRISSITIRRRIRSCLVLWLLLQVTLLSVAPPGHAVGPAGAGARVTVVGVGVTSIDLRIDTDQPAAPEGWLLAIPPTGDVSLEVLSPDVDRSPVTITATGWLRDQRVVRLSLLPRVGNQPDASATVRVSFSGALEAPTTPASPTDDPWFEGVLLDALLNYDQGLLWRQRPETTPDSPAAQSLYPPQPRLQVATPQAGIYRLDGAGLLAAGWPADWRASAGLSLSLHDRGYPLHVMDGGDGSIDPDDYLEFYAPPSTSRYAAGSVFWLDWISRTVDSLLLPTGIPAAAATTPAAFPETLRLEEAHVYDSNLAAEGEAWYWQRVTVRRNTATTYSFPFTLHHVQRTGDEATLSLRVAPLEAPPYQLTIRLNDRLLLDYLWTPTDGNVLSTAFPASILREGANAIELTLTHSGQSSAQSLLLDWFELLYEQRYASFADQAAFTAPKSGIWQFSIPGFSAPDVSAYDITTVDYPRRINTAEVRAQDDSFTLQFTAQGDTNTRFIAAAANAAQTPQLKLISPTDTLAPQAGADWIALAPPEMAPALEPLEQRRTAQGLRTRVIDPQAVYDAYADAGGQPDPIAIQRFLIDAYANWPGPPPTFVLLVGDGSYDPRNYLGVSRPLDIPPFLADIDPMIGETAVENRFAAVRGDDLIPDIAVGRVPVSAAGELTAVVAKILAYENQAPLADDNWPPQHFFLTDNPDSAGDFYLFADAATEAIPQNHRVAEAYFGLPPYESAPAARAAVVEALNQGLLTLNYVGHGTPDAWGGERLFGPELIPQLTNADHAPPAWSMSSLNGYFIEPANRSFLERMLVAPNGGISAYVASTGVGLAVGNYILQDGSLRQLLRRSPPLLGLGFLGGKVALYAAGPTYTQWLVQAYAYFGDPAQQLYLPQGGIYIPLVHVGEKAAVRLPFVGSALQPE